jgi:hypothetical protein
MRSLASCAYFDFLMETCQIAGCRSKRSPNTSASAKTPFMRGSANGTCRLIESDGFGSSSQTEVDDGCGLVVQQKRVEARNEELANDGSIASSGARNEMRVFDKVTKDFLCGSVLRCGRPDAWLRSRRLPVVAGIDLDPACRFPYEANNSAGSSNATSATVTPAELRTCLATPM